MLFIRHSTQQYPSRSRTARLTAAISAIRNRPQHQGQSLCLESQASTASRISALTLRRVRAANVLSALTCASLALAWRLKGVFRPVAGRPRFAGGVLITPSIGTSRHQKQQAIAY